MFDRAGEARRLVAQARYLNPFTERLFRAAGISDGMRILDLGSGMGDVALMAARLVGAKGEVVGVELSAETVRAARARVKEMGVKNIRFVRGDIRQLDILGTFDAAVGRFILMHMTDPAEALRSAVARLRPGGVLAIHEMELSWGPSVPMAPLWELLRGWFLETFSRAGIEVHMGLKLSESFVRVGLASPELMMDAIAGGGPDFPAYEWAEETMRAILPAAERLGVPVSNDIRVALARRLREEFIRLGAFAIWPPFVGAWARSASTRSAEIRRPAPNSPAEGPQVALSSSAEWARTGA